MITASDAILLRLHLHGFSPPPLGAEFRLGLFRAGDAEEVERLLVDARADGLAGEAGRQLGWFERVRRDSEWDPALVLLLRERSTNVLAAVAHSWRTGFLKDLAVAEAFRRRGLARALVGETAHLFRDRGVLRLELKVRPANAPARRLYRSLGFVAVGD